MTAALDRRRDRAPRRGRGGAASRTSRRAPRSGRCRMRCRCVGTRKAVVGRWRRRVSRAVAASKRLEDGQRPARQECAAGESDGDGVVHRRADHVQVVGVEVPDARPRPRRRVARVRLVPQPGRHALGPAGRPRRVVHGAGERDTGASSVGAPCLYDGRGARPR